MTHKPLRPSTIAAQGLGWTDMATDAVVLPMHNATSFIADLECAPSAW
jgi:hypothetical protein